MAIDKRPLAWLGLAGLILGAAAALSSLWAGTDVITGDGGGGIVRGGGGGGGGEVIRPLPPFLDPALDGLPEQAARGLKIAQSKATPFWHS